MSHHYKKQNTYLGALYLVLCKKRFIEMAVVHGMAVNLEAADQKKHVDEQGDSLLAAWEKQYQQDYTEMTAEILSAFWSSLCIKLVVGALGFLFAILNGSVNFNLSIAPVKCMSYFGSALVGWSALMQLGNDFTVWDGPAFPQKAHTVLFQAIFIPGLFFALLGLLL